MGIAAANADTLDLVRRLLGVARRRLGMEVAWLSEIRDGLEEIAVIEGDTSVHGLAPGDSRDLASSYSARIIRGELPPVITDTSANRTTAGLQVTYQMEIGAFAGTPICSEAGKPVGMLACASSSKAPHLSWADSQVLEMTADLVTELLSGDAPVAQNALSTRARVAKTMAEQEFFPVFQPMVSLSTGDVLGVEALTRFEAEPARPDIWFADAASVGLGVELELAAISAALERLGELPEGAFMSVNASPAAIADVRLLRILMDSEPTRIVVELTEHVAIGDYGTLLGALRELRQLGVRIAVDDVGAGFASFSHVLELSPNLLKMDMAITRGIDRDPARRAIATGVVELAASTGAQVVAEGVETPEELAAVAEVGVHAAQGFLLARPWVLPLEMTHYDLRINQQPQAAEDEDDTADKLGLAMLHSPIGMCLVALDGTFMQVNPALAGMLRYSPRELMGLTFQELTHSEDLDADLNLLRECLDGLRTTYRMEKRYLRKDGTVVWGDLSVVLVRGRNGAPDCFISQIVDVTERHVREELLSEKASTDHLTGLANRASAEREMSDLAVHKVPFGVLFCDLTDFNSVNSRLGHAVGDTVLQSAASRFVEAVRDKDTVARWGGDEFIVLVSDSEPGELLEVAGRLLEATSDPVELEDGRMVAHPLLAVGVAHYVPGKQASVEEVIREAKIDMRADRRRRGFGSQSRNGLVDRPH